MRARSIRDVAERHMCAGCGVCAFVQPDAIEMVDDLDQGRRPIVADGADTSEALACCPGIQLQHDDADPEVLQSLLPDWGPALQLWDGYAADDEIRWKGSSGGAATALALFALERREMHGVLHINARADVPWLNETVLSRSRDELVAATGSRYAPASPGDGLQRVVDAPGPCLMIGKPCDVAGARRAARIRPDLDRNLGMTIAIFCAGAPSTAGTLEMLSRMGFEDPNAVDEVRYRGEGWPGHARANGRDGRKSTLTYEQSWGEILNQYRPWRCYVCPDHTGEFADIAVGDPWYHEIPKDAPGRSLIVARTRRGREFVRHAVEAGYLVLEDAPADALPRAQPNLLATRGSVWGRIVATRCLAMLAPRLRNVPVRHAWLRSLSVKQKLRSFIGTWRWVARRSLLRRRPVTPLRRAQKDDAATRARS